MGFVKTATALVMHADTTEELWSARTASGTRVPFRGATKKASLLIRDYSPENYLLTHVTIMASVDTVEARGVKTGSELIENNRKINRPHRKYLITPETSKYVNDNCFPPGTLVTMGDGTVKSIEMVEVGDDVLTHRGRVRKVTRLYRNPFEGELCVVETPGGASRVRSTPEHPFYVKTAKGMQWVPASELVAGALLVRRGRFGKCLTSACPGQSEPYVGMVYNLEVEEDHTYVANGLVVHNCDSWDREVLLATYHTFRGAENYLEHVQIPEQSKGKIVDAVARDMGDTVYIDLLVATDKRHTELIKDIKSGKLNALSMGCTISHSTCTRCGNRAADEVQLCDHVKYQKGQTFVDDEGITRIIAELCGSPDDPDSVVFIEASWVNNPAFKGAVMRNILNDASTIGMEEDELIGKIRFAFENQMAHHVGAGTIDAFLKAASFLADRVAFGFDDDDDDEGGEKEDTNLVDDLVNKVKEDVKKRVEREIRDEVRQETHTPKDEEEQDAASQPVDGPNESIVRSHVVEEYARFKAKYASEIPHLGKLQQVFKVQQLMRQGSTTFGYPNDAILAAVYLLERDGKQKRASAPDLYNCLRKVGGTRNYESPQRFLKACYQALGRKFTWEEVQFLVQKGHLLN